MFYNKLRSAQAIFKISAADNSEKTKIGIFIIQLLFVVDL